MLRCVFTKAQGSRVHVRKPVQTLRISLLTTRFHSHYHSPILKTAMATASRCSSTVSPLHALFVACPAKSSSHVIVSNFIPYFCRVFLRSGDADAHSRATATYSVKQKISRHRSISFTCDTTKQTNSFTKKCSCPCQIAYAKDRLHAFRRQTYPSKKKSQLRHCARCRPTSRARTMASMWSSFTYVLLPPAVVLCVHRTPLSSLWALRPDHNTHACSLSVVFSDCS